MKESKTVSLTAFFAMLFSLTMLCIFLYFGGCEMSRCEKGFAIGFVFFICIGASICIGTSNDKRSSTKKQSGNNKEKAVVICTRDTKEPGYYHIKRYDTLAEMKDSKEDASFIILTEGVCIDHDLISFLEEKGYELPILKSDVKIDEKKDNGGN